MDITSIFSVTLSVANPGVTKPGFGEPLIYSANTIIPASEMARRYSSATYAVDMTADGFAESDPARLAADAICSQDPKPRTFKVGRGTQDFDHDVDLTCLTDTVGETIVVTIYGESPAVPGTIVSETYTRTCAGGGIPAEATALAGLITAGLWGAAGDITAAGAGNDVQIRAAAGFGTGMLYYENLHNLTIDDVSLTRTPATDLNAIVAVDSDWYCLVPADNFGGAELDALSNWANSQTNKIVVLATQDSDVLTAGGGVAAVISAQNDNQTFLMHSKRRLSLMPHAAAAGRFLPETPGTEVWAFKALTGCLPSVYTTTESGYAHANYCNTYTGVSIAGVSVTGGVLYKGWAQGSSATFIDTIRLIDAIVVEIQTELLALEIASRKVPFNDAGIGSIKNAILEAIRVFEGEKAGLLPGSAFCEVPKASEVSATDKANRDLPNVTFGATLNGSIATVTMVGTISF